MAKDRKKSPSDGRHLITVGLPLGTVLGVLILGALLQSGPPEAVAGGPAPAAEPLPPPSSYVVRREEPSEVAPAPAKQPAPVATRPAALPRQLEAAATEPDESISRLGRRALRDVDRLSAAANQWTSQVGVYCDTAHVSVLLKRHGSESSFYLLPALIEDRACFRVCWGRYQGQEQARRAGDLPEVLRGGGTFPRRVSSVIQ